MTLFHDPFSRSRKDENAPDSELERIEALLARSLRRNAVPVGLAHRVFDASVKLLGGTPRTLRFQPALARQARPAFWSRLALAASVAIAAMVGWPALTGTALDADISASVLSMAMSGAGDDAERFLSDDDSGLAEDAATTSDEAYMDTFGIMGTEVDDLLGEMSMIDSVLGS